VTDEGDVLDLIPFARTLGLSVVRDDPAHVVVRLDWDPGLCTSGGVLHGGVIMALADTAGGLCAFRNMAPDAAGTTTIESKTNFLRAVSSGYIVAAARPLHVGRTLIVIESEVSDDQERLIGKVIQSQLVLAR
jgi:1,4-dihydroxy-2-naphthoyl-CoA hydrolase